MSVLPPKAHLIAGKLEDQFEVWNKRDSDHPHPSTADAGARIVNLCEEMVQTFQALQEGTRKDLSDYLAALRGELLRRDNEEEGDTRGTDQ